MGMYLNFTLVSAQGVGDFAKTRKRHPSKAAR